LSIYSKTFRAIKLDIDILKNLEEWELEELKNNKNIIFDSDRISK
tara:strand:+ start:448 stop:582 length:135 start_codon:yes stop_codon:yes gene_type:complete